MKKTNIFNNIITNFSPVVEELIRNICIDLKNEGKTEEMLEKYLYDDKIKTLRNLVKKKNKSVRKKTSYSMFLAHNNIRKMNEKLTLKEYNMLKGKYWKTITKEEKDKYQAMADKWNMENMPYKMGKINQMKKKPQVIVEKQPPLDELFDQNVEEVIVEI
jgi:hypothetical protein